MSLSIVNNVSSLAAQNALDQTSNSLSTSLERLSTGLKLNSGADGPAALVIANEQQAQVVGLQQALTNTSQAIDVVQTGEGGLNEISSLLDQARSLALDSANSGVNDQTALDANQAQLANIISTINNIANTTQFGQKQLLNGTAGLTFNPADSQISLASGNATAAPSGTYTVNVTTQGAKALANAGAFVGFSGAQTGSLILNGVTVQFNAANAGSAQNAASTINGVTQQTGVTASVSGGKIVLTANNFGQDFTATDGGGSTNAITALGYGGNVVTSTATNVGVGGTAAVNAEGTVTDPNGNVFTAVGSGNTLNFNNGELSGLSIGLTANGAVTSLATGGSDTFTLTNNSLTFQIGANAGNTASIAFSSAEASALGQNAQGVVNASFTSLAAVTINTTQSDAQDAVRVIDQAIQNVSTEAGNLGAFQENTLQANSTNLQTALQNTTASESTIRDTNYASEISNFTNLQVQLQAGASVLSSSNQITGIVTQLLQKA